jgi:glyceraldehyde 3-phosphate dehydrogenase
MGVDGAAASPPAAAGRPPIRLAINGFGRVGRHVLRRAATEPDLEVVAVNNRGADPAVLALLFKHDSVLGRYPGEVRAVGRHLFIDGRPVEVLSVDNPELLPWAALRVEVVVEATGRFVTGPLAARHRRAGARKVLVTAPVRGADVTLVVGANEAAYDPAAHHVVSGASCTTACLAPVASVLHHRFGLRGGIATTVHAYTRDQELLDGNHSDPRRARAAPLNVVPTRTGVGRAIDAVLPELAGRIAGLALRVPVPNVSALSLAGTLERPGSAAEVNGAFEEAASGALRGILGISAEPLVSSDFRGDDRSAVIDLPSTTAAPEGLVSVLAWYDNEWAYACRMVDLVRLLARPAEPCRAEAPAIGTAEVAS